MKKIKHFLENLKKKNKDSEILPVANSGETALAEKSESCVVEGLARILPTLPDKLSVPNVSAIACKTNSYLY